MQLQMQHVAPGFLVLFWLFYFMLVFLLLLLHVTTTDCLVTRLLISLVLYSMFCLPRLFLFVATLHSAA